MKSPLQISNKELYLTVIRDKDIKDGFYNPVTFSSEHISVCCTISVVKNI